MLFNSYIFIFLFFPLAIVGYYTFHRFNKPRLALGYLLCMSMWFYGWNSIQYLLILIASVILNYFLVELLDRAQGLSARRVLLAAGIFLNLGILFYYKYYDFFIENLNGWFKAEFRYLELVLPLGISFYTFQQLSYVIDSYRRECEKYGFLEYATYVIFFPQLIAGPIVYHDELIPQLRDKKNHRLNYDNLSKGIYAFSLGLSKKVLIADTLSKIVVWGFDNKRYQTSLSGSIIMLCYALQIYFDFSGYCDMAYGIGYMFNVKLPFNFNSPYKASSIDEFWSRWHMTLTRFLTKYVYIPLGGSRKGTLRTYINILLVFFASGVWHGASWAFILWGVVHGAAKILERLFGRFFAWIPNIIRRIWTFIFVTLAWSLFRAETLDGFETFWRYTRKPVNGYGLYKSDLTEMFNNLTEIRALYRLGFGGIIEKYPLVPLLTFIAILILACFFMKNTQEKVEESAKYGKWRIAVTVVLITWSAMSLSDVSEFLYFNF